MPTIYIFKEDILKLLNLNVTDE